MIVLKRPLEQQSVGWHLSQKVPPKLENVNDGDDCEDDDQETEAKDVEEIEQPVD